MDMDIDLDAYVKKYFHIDREEMERIRKGTSSQSCFRFLVQCLHDCRERKKQHGTPSLQPQPIAQILSVTVKPNQDDKQLALYGTIYVHFFDAYNRPIALEIYTRGSDAPQILGTEATLTLNGPRYSCWPDHACLPLFGSRVNVNLFDQTNNIFANTSFSFDDIDDDYEQVKSMLLHCKQGSLTLQYIVIPLGVHSRVDLRICNKDVEKRDILNVNGKVVARHADTYGNYSSQECVLFNKEETEFEPVESGLKNIFPLSRCWVSLPAYSFLTIQVDLSEYGSGRKIGNGTITLLPQQGLMSGESLLLDDMVIKVNVAWFSPEPRGRNDYRCSTSLPQIPTKMAEEMETKQEFPTKEVEEIEEMDDGEDKSCTDDDDDDDDDDGESPCDEPGDVIEEMDTDGEDESSDDDDGESPVDDESPCDESGDMLSASLNRSSWSLRSHKNKPWSSPAVEIFSVSIHREKSKAVQIYGSIEVLYDEINLCYIFKRDEKNALGLSGKLKSIPIPDGSRVFDDCSSLKIEFDIKDVEGCLAIKGYVDWAASVLDSSFWYEKQLCSLIQGQHGGFVVVHYSIFTEAVLVNIKVLLYLKTGSSDVNPKVWGSLVTQYSRYDYSSRYNKDYYRIMLFKRTRDDLIQISNDSTIPLSRSTIVVPSYSSLIVNIDLSFGVSDQKLSCAKVIKIGEALKTVETSDYLLHIELDWCEIK